MAKATATATATERNDKLVNPGSDASKIVAFFEELQKLMTGIGDVYFAGTTDMPREWKIK